MSANHIRQIPGFLAFNAGVMFFMGVAVALLEQAGPLGAVQLKALGAGVLIALVAIAAGFASAARVEFARRDGRRLPFFWFAPAALVGAPLGFKLGAGEALVGVPMAPAAGVGLALLGLAWTLLQLKKAKA